MIPILVLVDIVISDRNTFYLKMTFNMFITK
jgi:hypothetical protein